MPANIDKKLLLIIGVIVFLLGLGGTYLVLNRYSGQKSTPVTQPENFGQEPIQEEAIPSLTPEEIDIISKLETHVVTLENDSFSPQNLTIKLHDQVEWRNQDQETYQIKGDGWGNVPIGPGESFTQAFDKVGIYSYSCSFHPGLTGTIIIE